MIWNTKKTLVDINEMGRGSMAAYLGIEFVELGDDYLIATMPIAGKTQTPQGFLHGGASCVLAETVGSVASTLCLNENRYRAAGVELNASHLRGVLQGKVTAVCHPFRIGRSLHVWDIRIQDDNDRLVCISRLTVAIVSLPSGPEPDQSAAAEST